MGSRGRGARSKREIKGEERVAGAGLWSEKQGLECTRQRDRRGEDSKKRGEY